MVKKHYSSVLEMRKNQFEIDQLSVLALSDSHLHWLGIWQLLHALTSKKPTRSYTSVYSYGLSGVAREGTGGDESPPVVLKNNFEIFLNLKRKVGRGGGYDDSNF